MSKKTKNIYQKHILNYHEYGGAQLRYDLFADNWVLVARENGSIPSDYAKEKIEIKAESVEIYEEPEGKEQDLDSLVYTDEKGEWTTRVFPNRFPAVQTNAPKHQADASEGPYPRLEAYGVHEIVLKKSDETNFALLDKMEIAEVLDAYQERYLTIMREKHIRSITIFHNHGFLAGGPEGGSVAYPHSQILALPVISNQVMQEVNACRKFLSQAGVNLFQTVAEYELEERKRVVYENDKFVVFCPFASKHAYQMRILPKKANSYFERITSEEKVALADALRNALRSLYDGLENPDYNYYLRTAPCNGQDYPEFSYYLEVIPRTKITAGFEAATDIDILPIAPEDAAAYLRGCIQNR